MSGRNKIRRRIGDVLAIPLGDGTYSYGRVIREPLIAFYDLRSEEVPPLKTVLSAPLAFILFVMSYAVEDGDWQVIGNRPLEDHLLGEPLFFKKDPLAGSLAVYRDSTGEEHPATRKSACIWSARPSGSPNTWWIDSVIITLGARNKWVESLRP